MAGGRLANLIGIISKIGPILDAVGGIDWTKIAPIIEQIIAIIGKLTGSPDAADIESTALSAETLAAATSALSAEDQAELTAQGIDLALIIQLVQLIVSLIRSLKGTAGE